MRNDNRTIQVAHLATTKPEHFVNIELYHTKGRGYYLSIRPQRETNGSVIFVLTDLERRLVVQNPRFNRVFLGSLAKSVDQMPEYTELLNLVVTKHKIEFLPVEGQQAPKGWSQIEAGDEQTAHQNESTHGQLQS